MSDEKKRKPKKQTVISTVDELENEVKKLEKEQIRLQKSLADTRGLLAACQTQAEKPIETNEESIKRKPTKKTNKLLGVK